MKRLFSLYTIVIMDKPVSHDGVEPITFKIPESPIRSHDRLPSDENQNHPLCELETMEIVNPAFADKDAFNHVDIVVIGGSSGAGKTSLFAHAKTSLEDAYAFRSAVAFPERDVNRPPRDSDAAFGESRQVDDADLSDPDYAVRWLRDLGDQQYTYGIRNIGKHAVVVLSANNALLRHLAENPDLLKDSQGRQRVLRVGVYTDEETRKQRFLARSGHEIDADGIAARLSDPTDVAKDPDLVDVAIDNSADAQDQTESTNASDHFKSFLERLAARRDIIVEMKWALQNQRE